jgi:hypothetical protein
MPKQANPALTIRQQVNLYRNAGLRVLPIAMPAKVPAVPEGFYGRDLPDATCEASHFGQRHQVGILCGRVEGRDDVELLGLDRDGDATWVQLEAALGVALPPTLSSKGDRHRFYWLPAGHTIDQCNRIAGLTIDTRPHAGGYFREPWEWDQPFTLDAIAALEHRAVEALARLSGESSAHDAPETEPTRPEDDVPDLSVLTPLFAPPGHSDGRYVVMRAIGGWLAQHGYHPDAIADAVVAHVPTDQPTRRGQEAADAARQLYAGGAHPPGWNVLVERFGAEVCAELEQVVRDPVVESWSARYAERLAAPPSEPPSEVPPRHAVVSDADALAALTPWVRAHVLAAQEELRTPVAMNIGFALGALAAACAGRLTVRVTHSYAFHTALYVCVVGSPGDNKSAAFNLACRPIHSWAAQVATEQRPRLAEHEDYLVECKAKRDALKDKRTRGYAPEDRPPATAEEALLSIKLSEPEPVPFRYVVGDVTNEKLADMLAQHGRLACLSSEAGKVFSVLEGQYAGKADLGVWLKAYDGEHDPVDRLNRTAEVPRYPYTVLSSCLAIQPSVLDGLGANPSLSGQGFMQRFCWIVTQSLQRRWGRGEEPTPVPQDVATAYDGRMTAMLERGSTEVLLSEAARKGPYLAYRDDLEDRRPGDMGVTVEVQGWAGKHLQRATRIAALLWAADGGEGQIMPDHMARAVTIAEWLVPHTLSAMGGVYTSATTQALAAVRDAHARLGRPIGARDFASRMPRGLRDDAKARRLWLDNMVETGHLAEPVKGKFVPVSRVSQC